MIPGLTAVAALPISAVPASISAATPDPLLALTSASGVTFLLEARPFDPSLEVEVAASPGPVAAAPVAALGFTVTGAETVARAASRTFITGPGDDPPHVSYPGRLRPPLAFSARLFDGEEPAGRSSAAAGEIVLENGDGALDAWLTYAWSGRPVEVRAAVAGAPLADFGLVLRAEAEDLDWTEGQITLRLRDKREVFDREIQQSRYAGTGGAEGRVELAGVAKPLAFGALLNVPPVQVDPGLVIYQLHDGPVQAVDAVYDKGIALTDDGDIGLAALFDVATSVTGGTFKTHLAGGFIRLGATPAGQVTADFSGAVVEGQHLATTAAIARHVLTNLSGGLVDPIADLDQGSFDVLEQAQPAKVGLYLAEPESAAAVLDRLLAGIGGAWTVTRQGRLAVNRLEAPGVPATTFTASDLAAVERMPTPAPSWRRRIGYSRAWQVQGDNDLAAGAPEALRALVGQELRFAEAEDSSVKGRWRFALEVTVEALFRFEVDAAAEASRTLVLHGPTEGRARDFYRVVLARPDFKNRLGQTLALQLPRFGLDQGRSFVVIQEDQEDLLSDRKTLTLWG